MHQGDGPSRPADVRAVVGAVARSVPSDPPETDDQTRGACAKVDREAVDKVLGAPAAVSRSLNYVNLSSVCSWATGTRNPRTVAVTVYSSQQAGPFLADQKNSEPSRDIPGISDDAFAIPGVAYAIAPDGQAVSCPGVPAGGRRPHAAAGDPAAHRPAGQRRDADAVAAARLHERLERRRRERPGVPVAGPLVAVRDLDQGRLAAGGAPERDGDREAGGQTRWAR